MKLFPNTINGIPLVDPGSKNSDKEVPIYKQYNGACSTDFYFINHEHYDAKSKDFYHIEIWEHHILDAYCAYVSITKNRNEEAKIIPLDGTLRRVDVKKIISDIAPGIYQTVKFRFEQR